MDRNALATAVKSEARRLGFDLAGITTPDPPSHFTLYQKWLQAGYHGEMAYLATERARRLRSDPRLILPDCRSILVVAARYPLASTASGVAAYARADDYHAVLMPRLNDLVAWLEAQAGEPVPHRVYVDTGPVLERELAQRAGLGWIGRNSCLIHPGLGSFLLLAEVLTGLEMEPDPPMVEDRCGRCARCLDACPASCILPNRTLDARRCISYLTIELKGSIPPSQRPDLHEWLFGCDQCQQVCPWNQRPSLETGKAAFQVRPALAELDPARLLGMTPQELRDTLRGSPLLRPMRRGLLRNAAVVLGNRGRREAIPALTTALREDSEPMVRAHAAWALGRIGSRRAWEALAAAQNAESDPVVALEIEAALGQTGQADEAR